MRLIGVGVEDGRHEKTKLTNEYKYVSKGVSDNRSQTPTDLSDRVEEAYGVVGDRMRRMELSY